MNCGIPDFGGGSTSYGSPSFFADGLSVLAPAGSTVTTYMNLEKIDVATGHTMTVVASLGNEARSVANRAVVSPDGTRAAFDGSLSSLATRIFVVNLGQ